MPRRECDRSENIVRAVTTAHWDEVEGRIRSSLFVGQDISVSRLAVLGLADLFEIFRLELGPPPRIGLAAAEINIGVLQDIGHRYTQAVHLTVEEAPLPKNPAHAEIPQRITKGLSKQIIRHLEMRKAS
ncbi:MAG TPA: hypothetical protein VF710_18140 [Longimicrobium sp.]|jgi:hypothetical protein